MCLYRPELDNVDYLLYKMSREKILSLYIECKNREKENENTENHNT